MRKVKSNNILIFLCQASESSFRRGERLGQYLVNSLYEEGDDPAPSVFYSGDNRFVLDWFLANCVEE